MKKIFAKLELGFIEIVFILSMVCTGLYHEYLACAAGIGMMIWLLLRLKKENRLRIKKNITVIAIMLLVLCYFLTIIWANDSGLAFIGFFKFLPVVLFLLVLLQEENSGERILNIMPYVAGAMTLLSVIAMYIPILDNYFTVSDRLAGFFQYPNTFALFLLVSELVLLGREKYKLYDFLFLPILIIGILLTGSRTVFLLAIASNGVTVLIHRNKRIRFLGIIGVILGVAAIVCYIVFFDKADIFGRLLKLSLTESTFVGRILYFTDALPLILRRPFGVGYLSYYYMQQSIQTGVYNIRYIHNDFLQIMLDVGWIPCIVFIVAIVKSIFSRSVTREKKLVLLVIAAHSCLDFNLQFIAMFMLLVLFMDYDSGEERLLKQNISLLRSSLYIGTCLACWIGFATFFSYIGEHRASDELYPWNTENQVALLGEITDLEEMNQIADDILNRNEYVTVAYSAKSRYAFSNGRFSELITYKNKLFENAPFQYSDYKEYCYMMMNGIVLFSENGDENSAKVCASELLKAYDEVKNVRDKLSKYGKMISVQPVTRFPQDIEEYVSELKQ